MLCVCAGACVYVCVCRGNDGVRGGALILMFLVAKQSPICATLFYKNS